MEIRSERYCNVAFADLQVRAADDDSGPHFEGWACRANTLDAYGTEFAPGAWAAGGLDGDLYALCWMHDPTVPAGTFSGEDRSEGLYIKGWWDDTSDGNDCRAKALSGSAPALSVGFRSAIFDEDKPNRIIAVQLVEVSQITARMAAVPGAELTSARSATATGRHKVAAARLRLRSTTLVGR